MREENKASWLWVSSSSSFPVMVLTRLISSGCSLLLLLLLLLLLHQATEVTVCQDQISSSQMTSLEKSNFCLCKTEKKWIKCFVQKNSFVWLSSLHNGLNYVLSSTCHNHNTFGELSPFCFNKKNGLGVSLFLAVTCFEERKHTQCCQFSVT